MKLLVKTMAIVAAGVSFFAVDRLAFSQEMVYFTIMDKYSRTCLGSFQSDADQGEHMAALDTCDGSDSRKWAFDSDGVEDEDPTKMRNKESGLCLARWSGETELERCDDGEDDPLWMLIVQDESTNSYTIEAADEYGSEGECLSVHDTDSPVRPGLGECDDQDSRHRWIVTESPPVYGVGPCLGGQPARGPSFASAPNGDGGTVTRDNPALGVVDSNGCTISYGVGSGRLPTAPVGGGAPPR